MGQMAHIRYQGGALLLPAQDPYDREIVFEEAEFCARRHGSVGVLLGRKEIRISLSANESRSPCSECRRAVGLTSFLIDRHRVCSSCARRLMGCAPRKR
jgi:hypothetical protein